MRGVDGLSEAVASDPRSDASACGTRALSMFSRHAHAVVPRRVRATCSRVERLIRQLPRTRLAIGFACLGMA